MLTRRTVILAKIEGTYGTDPTPTVSANALLVKNVEIKPTGEKLVRDYIHESLSPFSFVRGMRYVDVSFETELKGTGTIGALPAFGWEGCLFRACGMAESVVAGTRIVYAPVSTGFESCTLWVYRDGIYHRVNGCRGDVNITYEVGKYGVCKWTMQGLYAAPTDVSPSACTYSTVVPPVGLSAALTLDGTAFTTACAEKIEFKLGNKLAQRKCLNSSTGLTEVMITGRDPGGSLDPEAVLEATYPFWNKWETAATVALSIGPMGSVAGNRIAIAAPKSQFDDLSYADRNGILAYNTPLSFAQNTGDDELTITIT